MGSSSPSDQSGLNHDEDQSSEGGGGGYYPWAPPQQPSMVAPGGHSQPAGPGSNSQFEQGTQHRQGNGTEFYFDSGNAYSWVNDDGSQHQFDTPDANTQPHPSRPFFPQQHQQPSWDMQSQHAAYPHLSPHHAIHHMQQQQLPPQLERRANATLHEENLLLRHQLQSLLHAQTRQLPEMEELRANLQNLSMEMVNLRNSNCASSPTSQPSSGSPSSSGSRSSPTSPVDMSTIHDQRTPNAASHSSASTPASLQPPQILQQTSDCDAFTESELHQGLCFYSASTSPPLPPSPTTVTLPTGGYGASSSHPS